MTYEAIWFSFLWSLTFCSYSDQALDIQVYDQMQDSSKGGQHVPLQQKHWDAWRDFFGCRTFRNIGQCPKGLPGNSKYAVADVYTCSLSILCLSYDFSPQLNGLILARDSAILENDVIQPPYWPNFWFLRIFWFSMPKYPLCAKMALLSSGYPNKYLTGTNLPYYRHYSCHDTHSLIWCSVFS